MPASPAAAAAAATASAAAADDGGGGGASSSSSQQQQQPAVDPGSLLVERRSEVLTEQLNDCFSLMWDWALCGGPKARVRQLYVHGRLQRCMDEYHKFKSCLIGRADPARRAGAAPAPHPLWAIRTRGQAADFWGRHFAHIEGRRPQDAEDGLI